MVRRRVLDRGRSRQRGRRRLPVRRDPALDGQPGPGRLPRHRGVDVVRTLAVRRPGPLVAIALGYLTAASGVMIWRGISVSPDYLLLLMVPIALLSGRFLRFLGDWVPFVAIFLGWEAMRGIAPKTGIAPHIGDLASAETWVF